MAQLLDRLHNDGTKIILQYISTHFLLQQ